MYTAARPTSARSSARSNSPRSGTACASGPSVTRAASAIAFAACASDGPDVRMIRRAGSRRASATTSASNDSRGHRRNGLPALTWITTRGWTPLIPAARSRRSTPAAACGSSGHLQWIARGIGRSDAERRQQIPLVGDRVTRRFVSGPLHDVGVHPRAPLDVVADACRRAARPCEPCGAGTAVQIDCDVEPLAAQPPRDRHIVAQAREAACLRDHQQRADVWIVANDGGGARFNQVCQLRVRDTGAAAPAAAASSAQRRR